MENKISVCSVKSDLNKMKKLLIALILCIPLSSKAQFVLTPKGFVSSEDQTKDFIVYNFDGKSQKELYKAGLIFATSYYKSPKDVISKVEDEMVTIIGFEGKEIGVGKVIGKMYTYVYDLSYTLVLRFKDGKIRIDAPSFECQTISDGRENKLTLIENNAGFGTTLKLPIFNKSGEVIKSKESAKAQLEVFFNTLSGNIKSSISDKNRTNW